MKLASALLLFAATEAANTALVFETDGQPIKVEAPGAEDVLTLSWAEGSVNLIELESLPGRVATLESILMHPCDASNVCDSVNGICSKAPLGGSNAIKTVKGGIHDLVTYHCGCKTGYNWQDSSNAGDYACESTPAPTPAPTSSPTGYPTAYPTAFPTGFPTTYPTAFPTGFPTTYPTPNSRTLSARIANNGPYYDGRFPPRAVLDPTWRGGSHNSQQTWLTPNHRNSWFTLDLYGSKTVTGFKLLNTCNHPHGDRSTHGYRIEVSSNNRNWRTVKNGGLHSCRNIHGTPIFIGIGAQSNVRYVKFSTTSFRHNGGGLNYFAAVGF